MTSDGLSHRAGQQRQHQHPPDQCCRLLRQVCRGVANPSAAVSGAPPDFFMFGGTDHWELLVHASMAALERGIDGGRVKDGGVVAACPLAGMHAVVHAWRWGACSDCSACTAGPAHCPPCGSR
jgi:hypothetical protein